MTSLVSGLRSLGADEQLDRIVALEREINRLHAEQLAAITVFDETRRRSRFEMDKDFVAVDIAAALQLSPATGSDRLAFAREVARMPRLLALLHAGEVTMMHARVAARETYRLDRAQVDAVLDRVLPRATTQTVGQFARSVRRAVAAIDAEPQTRRAKAFADRRVAFRPGADGMSDVYAFLGADAASAIESRIDREARRLVPGDARTLEQRRADAFVALLLGSVPDAPAPVTTTVNVVTIAESTLAGRDDEPAELERHGPISAEHGRELAARDGVSVREFRIDPAGRLLDIVDARRRDAVAGHRLDLGRTTRVAPTALDRFVRARDVTCRFPGCTSPAATAELDHIVAWGEGGRTSADNLHALCRGHHHAKHDGGWKVSRRSDGTTVWISPTRHRYEVPPHSYLPPRGPDPPA